MRVTPLFLLISALFFTAQCAPRDNYFMEWMAQGKKETSVTGKESIPEFRRKFLTRVGEWAEDLLETTFKGAQASEYPYFNFMPQYMASAIPDGSSVSWTAPCFQSSSASAVTNDDGSITVTLELSNPSSLTCSDYYFFLTASGWEYESYFTRGSHTLQWTLPDDVTDSEKWDVQTKGIRIMRLLTTPAETVANIFETVKMFEPEFTQGVSDKAAAVNLDFMAKYPQFPMSERDESTNVIPDESEVQSGDFFGIIRLDGLDPMLAWGMGSTTGHTTMALWIDGELYVTESTVNDSYWPTNGVQKTPYRTWVQQAQDAGFSTVHVPLSAERAAKFNETAAVEFFNSVEGLDYGYHVMLWGWIDTIMNNYPCLPPDYSSECLQWELIETVFSLIDRAVPQIADLMWIEAWNKRLNTTGLRTADLYYEAYLQGIDASVIPTIPEQDSWLYQTTRYGEPAVGKSMVCCVFVCNGWKAAGLFDDIDSDFNCGELTNWDDYALDIFEGTYQQMTGKYTLSLNNFNSRDPYPEMYETCPSLAPNYERSLDC